MKTPVCQRHKCIEAIQAHRMEAIRLMIAGMSHDLNNLLMGIWAHSSSIQRLTLDKEIRKKCVGIARLCEKMTDMIKKMLLLTKNGCQLRPGRLNLNQEVEKNLQMLRDMISLSIKIKMDLDPALPLIYADSTAITEIITNLVLNAAQALSPGGVITIKTSVVTVTENDCLEHANAYPGKFVTLTVVDNGPGISPEDLPRIFDPYFSTKKGCRNHGLGLAVVYALMDAQAGWVHVESELKKGTKFELYFPIRSMTRC